MTIRIVSMTISPFRLTMTNCKLTNRTGPCRPVTLASAPESLDDRSADGRDDNEHGEPRPCDRHDWTSSLTVGFPEETDSMIPTPMATRAPVASQIGATRR